MKASIPPPSFAEHSPFSDILYACNSAPGHILRVVWALDTSPYYFVSIHAGIYSEMPMACGGL